MNIHQNTYEFIEDNETYEQYIKNLPKIIPEHFYNIQMRAMAVTAPSGREAIVFFVPDETREYTLLIPYNMMLSFMEKRNKETLGETLDELASLGLLAETGFELIEKEFLGDPVEVDNSVDPALEKHVKYFMVIKNKTLDHLKDEHLFMGKTGQPVWVRNSLLPRIYDSFETINGKPRRHPQREAFRRYIEWLGYHNFEIPVYEKMA